MAIQSATISLLVERAKFEPQIAVAIAEAIEMTIASAQLVTVPVLDARLAELRGELRSELAELRAELVRWVLLLGNVALTGGITAILNALQRG